MSDDPAPTPGRSRQQTEYIVLAVEPRKTHNATSTETEDTSKEKFSILGRVKAWSAKAALDSLEDKTRAEAAASKLEIVLVPSSSWHVFAPTTTFEEIK